MRASVDVFVRSYFRDIDLLRVCLSSIDRHLDGQRTVHVVLPRSTVRRIDVSWIERAFRVVLHECPEYPHDYVGQQITKLHADRYSDAAFILFLDSDQRFVGHCDLGRELFDPSGRLRFPLGRNGARRESDGWRRCARRFFGHSFDRDLAGALPLAVPARIFPGLRAEAQRRHGVSLEDYALALRGDTLCEAALFAGWLRLHAMEEIAFLEDEGEELLAACVTSWSRSAQADRGPRQ